MGYLIESDLEFYEVLNAFPIIRDKLQKLDFNVSEIVEGITVHDYFERKSYSEDEIDLMVKRLNCEIKSFLKNTEQIKPSCDKTQNHEFNLEEEESLEEE